MDFPVPRVFTDSTRVPPGCSGDGMGSAGEGLGGYLIVLYVYVYGIQVDMDDQTLPDGLPHARPLGEGRRICPHNLSVAL